MADPLDKQLVEAVLTAPAPRQGRPRGGPARLPAAAVESAAVAADDDEDDDLDDEDLELAPRPDGATSRPSSVSRSSTTPDARRIAAGRGPGQARREGARGAHRRRSSRRSRPT